MTQQRTRTKCLRCGVFLEPPLCLEICELRVMGDRVVLGVSPQGHVCETCIDVAGTDPDAFWDKGWGRDL